MSGNRRSFGVFLALLSGWIVLAYGQAPIGDETKREAREAIERYVKKDVELKEAFLVLDPRSGEPLRLSFDHVHEGVKAHPKGYLACVDFKDAAGAVYDVDVVVARAGGAMEAREVFVHKVDGQVVTEPAGGGR